MKVFDNLYRRSKTGAIVYYKVGVDEGDVDHAPIIVKESGQLGTSSPVLHRETIQQGMNLGKSNETTPVQQACLQAESDWKKKKDSGYKSLPDLGIVANNIPGSYSTTVAGTGNPDYTSNIGGLGDMLQLVLPQFNSDASGNVKPMLAKDWKKVSKIEYPCFCEPKLDGVRCLMIVRPDEGGEMPEITFLSRSGKQYTTLEHIGRAIIEAMDELPIGEFILDGEVYSDELTFQEITQAVKKQYPNSLKLHFRAYDVVSDLSQWDRKLQLINLTNSIGSEFVQRIEWTIVNSAEEVKMYHDQYVQKGNEGAILRAKYGKYEQGFRSSSLLKVKEFDETEYLFVRWEKGQRDEDLLAVCRMHDGTEFRAKMIGTRAEKAAIDTTAKPKEGLAITIKHFGKTTDGLPRFPVGKGIRDYE